MIAPRIEIDLKKIAHNTRSLIALYGAKGISITGVTKGVCGHAKIASILVKNGINTLGDSRLSNIVKMRKKGIEAQFLLLRSPMLSQAQAVVEHTECSLNSELSVLNKLNHFAQLSGTIHQVILMVEMGDLREGIMPKNLNNTIAQLLKLKSLKLVGLGTNLACMGGITPDENKMQELTSITSAVEDKFGIQLKTISGGNSANYQWFIQSKKVSRVNNLRIGESIYLGRETLDRKPIPGLFIDAFVLVAEVIELKTKPSLPYGQSGQNAFGVKPTFKDQGEMLRAIIAIGLQDVHVSGLRPKSNFKILSASSDHIVIDTRKERLSVGQEVRFDVNYSALLSLMTSPYISKSLITS